MKQSDGLQVNRFYFSKRHKEYGLCTKVARYLMYLEFEDKKLDGWFHCQEIEKKDNNIIDLH